MTAWPEVALHYLVRFGNGLDYTEVEDLEGEVPVIGSGGPFTRASRPLYTGESVLFGRKGTIDKPRHESAPFWTVDTMLYTVLGPRVHGRWLYYWATTVPFGLYSTSTALPSMTSAVLGRLRVKLPPLVQQRTIAAFLDRETAKIDALIEKQDSLIDRLRERREVLIRTAVVGTDHTVDRKPVPESPWLGTIPEHWATRPLWTLFRREKRTGFVDEPMVSVFRDHGVVFKDDFANLNVTAEDRSIYQLVEPGWLVINRMKAWQGSVGVSAIRGISSGHYLCFRPLHSESPEYLNWLFRSPQYRDGFAQLSRGVRPGQAEIDNDLLRHLAVVLPPVAEQRAILHRIQEATAEIDALAAKAMRFVELAWERRSALITAAVTGQIDLTGEVAA